MLLIGDWTVHQELDRLTQHDEEVHITPKAMDVLIHLADNQGKLVTKEALLDTHWRGAISGDNAVHKAMAELRRVFGDNPRNPSYIETFPKRGYLLIADVTNTKYNNRRGDRPNRNIQALAISEPITAPVLPVQKILADDAIISVLPFQNLVPGGEFEHFGAGVAAEITNALGRSGLVKTISHSASNQLFNDATMTLDPVKIGKALNVTHVLEGAIRKDKEMVRITAQLLDTSDGTQCAAKRFDHHLSPEAAGALIATQEEIALPVLNLLYDYFGIARQARPISRVSRSPDQSYLNDIFDR